MLSENARLQFDLIQQRLSQLDKRDKLLNERVEELEDFVENASVPLHKINGSGIITWANQCELEFMGYRAEEYVGCHISNFHDDQQVIEDILARLINKETLMNYPARLKCKNGEVKHVLINSNALFRNGKFVYTRCFTRDITDLYKQAQLRMEQLNLLTLENLELKARVAQQAM